MDVILPAELRRFITRFDAGEYWLAHEELEALWLRDRRDVYKGLIHLAAACLHLQRGNRAGALTKLRSGAAAITGDHDGLDSLDCAGLVGAVHELAARADSNSSPALPWHRLADYFTGYEPAPLPPETLPYRVRRYAKGYRPGRDPRRRD